MSDTPKLVPCRCCGNQVSSEAPTCPRCGQPFPQPATDWEIGAKKLYLSGNRIGAIKMVREHTGLDLNRAIEFVAQWPKP